MDSLAQWRHRESQRRERVAFFVGLGLSRDEARLQVKDELGRAAHRARSAGAKLREIGDALGVSKSMAQTHARHGERMAALNVNTPLERMLSRNVHRTA